MRQRLNGERRPSFLIGQATNMATGGMLMKVAQVVQPGTRCRVIFPEDLRERVPDSLYGNVVRCQHEYAGFFVAIKFEQPVSVAG